MNIAIILASGIGKRMGAGKNKVLLKLGGKSIVYYSALPFEKTKMVDGILVVARKEELGLFKELFRKTGFKKIIDVIEGGSERQESSFNAIKYLENIFSAKQIKESMILFHNGANPFVQEQEIEIALLVAKKIGACAVAHPTKDTIKQVNKNNLVEQTLDRSRLWNMQTPQVIKLKLAAEAFNLAHKDRYVGTDDVSLVERLGKKVKIIEASPYNTKITTPMDYELAKIIIRRKLC